MKHYWINIDNRKDRKEYMKEQFDKFNIPNERISATTPETIDNYKINYYDGKVRTIPEYSCLISHFNAIKKGYEDGDEYFCITEDDFFLPYKIDFDKILKYIKDTDKNIEILQLHSSNHEIIQKLYNKLLITNNLLVKRTEEYEKAHGCIYYLVSREGAKKLLDKFVLENNLIDLNFHDLCVSDYLLYMSVNTYILSYPIILLNVNLGTNIIQGNTPVYQFIYMENGNNIIKKIWQENNLFNYLT